MAASAGSFTQPLRVFFKVGYDLRQQLDPSPIFHRILNASQSGAARVEPGVDRYLIMPIVRATQWISRVVQWIQFGDFRAYCLYVVAALFMLLLAVML